MSPQEMHDALASVRHRLKTDFGVAALYVFGSVARGEATPESDVDLLVEFEGRPTFARFMDLKALLGAVRRCLTALSASPASARRSMSEGGPEEPIS